MKRLLFILSVLYSTASYANTYLKLNVAGNKITSLKQYALVSPEISGGIGYYLSERYRIDIMVGSSSFNFNDRYISCNDIIDESTISGTNRLKYKANIKHLMLNNYLNIISNDKFKIFVSGGVGISEIKEKIISLFSGMIINGNIITVPLHVEHYENKSSNNFAYSLGFGSSIMVNSKLNLELAYNYKDFGIPKYKMKDLSVLPPIKRYKGHNLSIGIRFDL